MRIATSTTGIKLVSPLMLTATSTTGIKLANTLCYMLQYGQAEKLVSIELVSCNWCRKTKKNPPDFSEGRKC